MEVGTNHDVNKKDTHSAENNKQLWVSPELHEFDCRVYVEGRMGGAHDGNSGSGKS